MRILIWTQDFYPAIGGIETHVTILTQQLKAHGHECLIVTELGLNKGNWRSEETWNGIKVYRFPFYTALLSCKLKMVSDISQSLQACIDEFQPDIVHMNITLYSLILIRSYIKRIKNRAPTLITIHGLLNYKYNKDMERFFDSMDWINCVSASTLDEFLTQHPNQRHKSSFIYNGVRPFTLLPTPLPYDPIRILCLGRLAHEKGFDRAIAAFFLISKKFPHIELVMAGDGQNRKEIVKLVATLQLHDRVKFLREIPLNQVPTIINQCTMIVVPSRYETFGLAAIEAGFLARPVIAMKVGGLQEIFTHEETALMVDNDDIHGLAEQMAFLIDNPDAAQAIGNRGRQHLLKTFNAEKMYSEYLHLYQRLVHQRLEHENRLVAN